ncbi:phenylacetaldoxime dehydratase family protein [Aspergillus ibericus CBS 121593]|uniref:Aldoxime dehydratase n=1 Tax=Aspergillus ibericus CBS 121593 TaxID=1448316 RepID=A0A395GSC4_9EURO|nr:aldoxime dehydratase [Aspergillus ibericus CBS 121593]RAK97868.1 aldoxime dehydratase [Aspergillus ibericus CBS 121593]WLO97399.1 aldoxime dehydratase [synthetic construct]
MFLASLPPNTPFTLTIIGTQPHTPTALITTLNALLTTAQTDSLLTHTETLTQHSPTSNATSTIHLTYWPTPSYQTWSTSPAVTTFFSTLPDTAGIYREALTIHPDRIQGASNHNTPSGCMHMGKIELQPHLSGYWGCYPDRITEKNISCPFSTEDIATNDPPSSTPSPGSNKIIPGKTTITTIPPNLCFVIEGQDHTAASETEKSYWTENFNALAQEWVSDVLTAGPKKGVLSSRACYNPSTTTTTSTPLTLEETKAYPLTLTRDIQLLYFLDLNHMEKLGRTHIGHVKLRKSFMEAYGPGGVMFPGGLKLWVETAVLREGDFEGVYVGCVEGTGLMGLKF